MRARAPAGQGFSVSIPSLVHVNLSLDEEPDRFWPGLPVIQTRMLPAGAPARARLKGGIFNLSSKYSIRRPYKVNRTHVRDHFWRGLPCVFPNCPHARAQNVARFPARPPSPHWYWVEQSSFTQSFRPQLLTHYGDQNLNKYLIPAHGSLNNYRQFVINL